MLLIRLLLSCERRALILGLPTYRPPQLYWCNGAQIASPHDKEVLQSIEEQLEPWSAFCWDEELAESCSLRTDPLTQINSCYMDELASLCFRR